MQYIIKGGIPLAGTVEISGAKNAALPILAAAIMTDETVTIDNLPDVSDIHAMIDAIKGLGAHVEYTNSHAIKVNASMIRTQSVDSNCIRKIRASYYLLGALLGKFGEAESPIPGGCDIGTRPIDQHLKGFRALGASADIDKGNIVVSGKLSGAEIFLDVVSVGATINIMLAAVLADGQTIIDNAAKEPHIVDTANFLNTMGAKIRGAGTDTIRITGVKKLHGCSYSVVPDMIEAGTFMIASAVTRGDVTVHNVIPRHLEAVSAKLGEIGAEIVSGDDWIRVVVKKRLGKTNIKTLPYPGFPTDMQPQMSVALALSDGTSVISESIFENRFRYTGELVKMGAEIVTEGNMAFISGIEQFTGAHISSPDLRAGAALVLAGLNADGITVVDDIHYILRGYERFDEKLKSIGAQIKLAESELDVRKFILTAC